MRNPVLWLAAVPLCWLASSAEDAPLKSRITSVGLFKNGLAVVRREVVLPGPGTFVLGDVPEPVHGTWWVESDVPVETRVSTRELPATGGAGGLLIARWRDSADFENALIGKQVSIYFADAKLATVTGKVEAITPPRKEGAWSRDYQQPRYDYWQGRYDSGGAAPQARAPYLVVQTEKERVLVDASLISHLSAEGKDLALKQRAPTLYVTSEKAGAISVSYLAKGMAWAPSYRVDVSDPKTLSIALSAALKNELEDLERAEVQLISGFPSIEFSHVLSPLSPRTTWAAFFQQLNQRPSSGHESTLNVAYQQAVMANDPGVGAGGGGVPAMSEGVDVHYQSIGARTLKQGDALSLLIASDQASYERIVEWIVPDTRDENGRYLDEYRRQREAGKVKDAAWDALRFKNPFKIPMTTGPAMVVSKGRFNGQSMSYWVSPGEETTLHITKALSVRTRSTEQEEMGERKIVKVAWGEFQATTVTGELLICNHRKEELKTAIRRRFSGELIRADEGPKVELREEGVYSINPRNELNWTIVLKPGETKTLKYTYSVLVRR